MIRLIIPIILLFLFDWYAFQAFEFWSTDWDTGKTIFLNISYWTIPVLVLISMFLAITNRKLLTAWKGFSNFRAFLTIAYLSKLFIVLVLILDDLRRIVMDLFAAASGGSADVMRSEVMVNLALFMGLIPFGLLMYGMIRNRYRYKIFRETVHVAGLPKALEGLKIVQISDIHSGSFAPDAPIQKGIDMINAEQADLVFFTGDLVNNIASEIEPYIEVFKQIKSRFGVFSITGNHDYGDYVAWQSLDEKQSNFHRLIQNHQKMGWQLLMNEHRVLDINGASVAIIGVENYSASARFSKYGNLSQAYQGSEAADLKLLLSHDPSHWGNEVLKNFNDIALTFSGHTHGMQFGIEIPGWLKWSPVKYVYKEWAGLYQAGKQFLYVNRGFGFLGYPGRVGILPEITVIEMKSESD